MPQTTQPHTGLRLINAAEVARLLSATKSHVQYLRRVDPTFPAAVRLGNSFNSAARWVEHEVIAWIESRMEARDIDRADLRERAKKMAVESLRTR